jgi:hypothetical protein
LYHGQSSETTDGSLNAHVERLPWINDRVRELIGARRPEGRRVLQTLHLALLAHLHLRYPEGEATLTRSDIIDWLECEDSTPRRILNELRRAGLIEYRAGRRGVCHIAAPAVTQPVLPLEVTPAESLRNHHGISAESVRNHFPSPIPPPMHVPEGDSLLGTPDLRFPRSTQSREETARARDKTRLGDVIDCGLHERRQAVAGQARLTQHEYQRCSAIFVQGGTLADFDEAIEVWTGLQAAGRAPGGDQGWRYVLSMVDSALAGRIEFLAAAEKAAGSPPAERVAPPKAQPRAGSGGGAPGWRGRGPARQETMAEQHDRLMRELEESRANGNGRRGF